MNAQRVYSIDTFRGLGILLVVLGHTQGLPAELHRYIYSFHMPAFFILSGHLFNAGTARLNPANYVAEKFRRLVVPAWCIGAICGLVFIAKVALHKVTWLAFLGLAVGTFSGFPRADGNFLTTPLWFLFCLFCVELMATLAVTFSHRFSAVTMIVIGVGGIWLSPYVPYTAFDINIAVAAALFFGLGMAVRDSGLRPFNQYGTLGTRVAMTAGPGAAWLLVTYGATEALSMSDNYFGSTVGSMVINGASAILGTILLCQIATSLPNLGALRWLGTHTVPILGFNYLVSAAVVHILDAMHANQWPLSFLLQAAALAIVALALDRTSPLGNTINGRYRRQAGRETLL